MNVDVLHDELDRLAGPEPDHHAGRRNVRSRVRRRRTGVGALALAAVLAVAAVPFVVAERRPGGPSVETGPADDAPAAGTHRITSARFGFSVDVPDDWTVELGDPSNKVMPLLFSARSSDSPPLPRLEQCEQWADVETVSVRVQEVGHRQPFRSRITTADPAIEQSLTFERPPHFGPPYGATTTTCPDTVWRDVTFNQHGRGFSALVVGGGRSSPADFDRAYRVLDSFRVGRPTLATFCTAAFNTATAEAGGGYTIDTVATMFPLFRRAAPTAALRRAVGIVAADFPSVHGNSSRAVVDAYRVLNESLSRCGLGDEILVMPGAGSRQ